MRNKSIEKSFWMRVGAEDGSGLMERSKKPAIRWPKATAKRPLGR